MRTKYNFRSNLNLRASLILASSILFTAPVQAYDGQDLCLKLGQIKTMHDDIQVQIDNLAAPSSKTAYPLGGEFKWYFHQKAAMRADRIYNRFCGRNAIGHHIYGNDPLHDCAYVDMIISHSKCIGAGPWPRRWVDFPPM
jgi:hypothetical protein